jgi:peptidoglycan hydrolase CwlO-like protein
MTYINQELTKHKKSIEALHHEIDSITFSYHETQGELNGQKERNAQILKKLELVKTELALSNQTIEEQREKIIVMSKDLQVHEERQYYMKEHYEEELYDSEIMENTLREEKNELSMQLKRTK